MSTHASISMKTDKGYRTIYVHCDGYINGVGQVLKEYYTDEAVIEKLLDLGDLSSLGEVPESKPELWDLDYNGDFRTDSRRYCISYRDRGEEDVDAKYFKSLKAIVKNMDAEYLYVWKDGKWRVSTGNQFKDL